GFDDDDLLHLLETVAGHEMDEQGVALRDALLAETAGNPFFVAEILRHLAETGAIYPQDDGRWVAASTHPPSGPREAGGGAATPTYAQSDFRSACARWSVGAWRGSVPTPNGSSGSVRSSAAT